MESTDRDKFKGWGGGRGGGGTCDEIMLIVPSSPLPAFANTYCTV